MKTLEDIRSMSRSKTESDLDDFVILLTTLITVVGAVWFLILALDMLRGPPSIEFIPQSGVWIQGVQFNQIILSLSTTTAGLTLRGVWQISRTLWRYHRMKQTFQRVNGHVYQESN